VILLQMLLHEQKRAVCWSPRLVLVVLHSGSVQGLLERWRQRRQ